MAIIKTIPSTRLINGEILETSEISIVSEREYRTNGEETFPVLDYYLKKGIMKNIVAKI